eukprot:9492000-Pyramimonas_sp.AAC.1
MTYITGRMSLSRRARLTRSSTVVVRFSQEELPSAVSWLSCEVQTNSVGGRLSQDYWFVRCRERLVDGVTQKSRWTTWSIKGADGAVKPSQRPRHEERLLQ